jgi:hypothetical protein
MFGLGIWELLAWAGLCVVFFVPPFFIAAYVLNKRAHASRLRESDLD